MTSVVDADVERSKRLRRIRPWLVFGVLFLAAGTYDVWRDPRMNSGPTWMFVILGFIHIAVWVSRRLEI